MATLKKAITVQVAQLLQNSPPNTKVTLPDSNNMAQFDVTITGPEGTAYEGGIFLVKVTLDAEKFPNKGPDAIFITKIYHPNIERKTGIVCPEAITNGPWRPAMKLAKFVDGIVTLLKQPRTDHALEPEIAAEYTTNREQFEQTAKQWTQEHAH